MRHDFPQQKTCLQAFSICYCLSELSDILTALPICSSPHLLNLSLQSSASLSSYSDNPCLCFGPLPVSSSCSQCAPFLASTRLLCLKNPSHIPSFLPLSIWTVLKRQEGRPHCPAPSHLQRGLSRSAGSCSPWKHHPSSHVSTCGLNHSELAKV